MRKTFILLITLSFFSAIEAENAKPDNFNNYFRLLPMPQKIEFLSGRSLSYNDIRSLHLEGTERRPVLDQSLDRLPSSEARGKGVVTLSLSGGTGIPDSPEGYVLVIANGRAEISSRGDAGLFYGCQTLAQLMDDAHDQDVDIPACRITDYPEVPYRSVHLDIRFHLDAGHFYYDLIDRLARIKINAVIVELEDKLRYMKSPLVGSANAISIDEFSAISRYAKARNIDISPLVQGLGHAGHILKHEEYSHLRDNPYSDWAFDALNPGTYDLLFSLYEDAMRATPYGKYLHVGGDEVYNLGQSKLAKQSGMKPVELQLYWLNKVTEFAVKHGRIPICWDDMPFSLAGLTRTMRNNPKGLTEEQIENIWKENRYKLDEYAGQFPEECVYMRWTYWNTRVAGNLKAIDWLLSQNLRVMGATAAQDMSPLLPRNNSLFDPIKDFCQIASEKKLDGILCTMWDDSAYSFETFWRGIFNFASMSWNYQDVKAEEFNNTFRHRFYAPALNHTSCEFQNLLEQALWFWDGSLINNSNYERHLSKEGVYNPFGDRGDRRVYPKKLELISLPDRGNPGLWCKKYSGKISQAKAEITRYKVIKEKIAAAMTLARRNRYSLNLMDRINEFQIYSSKLLLLLEKYDMAASDDQRSQIKEEIRNYVASFSSIRKNLEEIISEKRFLKNPEGYVRAVTSDLANTGTDNEWMFVHETPMNEKIITWMKDN